MGFLVVIPFGALAGWAIARILLWLRRDDFGPEWRRALLLLALAGAGLGTRFAFFTTYNVANNHLEGFPIPLAI